MWLTPGRTSGRKQTTPKLKRGHCTADLVEDLVMDGETHVYVRAFVIWETLLVERILLLQLDKKNGWMKYRELLPFLTSRAPPPDMKGRVYDSCFRNSMTYGSETMPLLADVG